MTADVLGKPAFPGARTLIAPPSWRCIGAFLLVVSRADGRPNGAVRTPRAISPMSDTTADAVAAPPAPGPTSVIGAMASASMVTALVTPMTCAIALSFGSMQGWTRCSTPCCIAWACTW